MDETIGRASSHEIRGAELSGESRGKGCGVTGHRALLNPNPGTPCCRHSNEKPLDPGSLSRRHLFNAPPLAQLCARLILCKPHDNPTCAHWPVFRGGNGSSEECKDTSRVTQPTFCKEKTGRLPGLPLRLRGSHDTPCFKLPVSCLQFLASYSSPSFHLLSCQLREAWGKPGHEPAAAQVPGPRDRWGLQSLP